MGSPHALALRVQAKARSALAISGDAVIGNDTGKQAGG
jgi:hypothetical protein